jgi:hypothetical protein
MAENIAPIEVKFKVDTSGLRKAETAVGKSGGKLKSKFGKIGKTAGIALAAGIGVAAVGAARKLSSFFGTAIDESSRLEESLNAVSVAYGEASEEVTKLGEDSATRLGLAQADFNAIATQFSAFGQQIAGEGGDVAATIDELTTRGADFASVYDLDVDEALNKFQSGLAGETESLRKFGVDLSAAAVETFAYENGIAKVGETLTEQQKVQARYGALLEQTAKVEGDRANTADSFANQSRTLKAELTDLSAEVGDELVPIQLELLKAFRDSLPVIKDNLLPAFKDMAGSVKDNLVPALKDMLPKIVTFVGLVVNNIDKIVVLAGIVAGLATTMKVYTGIQIALNIAMASNPIGLIITAIAILVPILVLLFGDMEKLKAAFEGFMEIGEKVAGAIMEGLGAAFQFVADFFASIPDKLASFGETLYNFGKDVWGNFVQGALDILFFLPGKVADILGSIPGLEGLAEGITSGITASREAVTGMTGTQGTVAKRVAADAVTTVNNYNVEARGLTVDQVQQDAKRRGNLMSPVLGGA